MNAVYHASFAGSRTLGQDKVSRGGEKRRVMERTEASASEARAGLNLEAGRARASSGYACAPAFSGCSILYVCVCARACVSVAADCKL